MGGRFIPESEIIGKKFSNLTAVKYSRTDHRHSRHFIFKCDCGSTKEYRLSAVTTGRTKTCGCSASTSQVTHGMTGTRTYKSWDSMMQRCFNVGTVNYDIYGGRGITVCESWQKFQNFFDDMGVRPDGMSLDRIDANANYGPDNCRWATFNEQMNNQRKTVRLKVGNEVLTLKEWSERTGVPVAVIRGRKQRGVANADAVSRPLGWRPNVYRKKTIAR